MLKEFSGDRKYPGFLNYDSDNDRCRVSWHNFCPWKAVEVEYLQNFSVVFKEAVHAPPELKFSFLSHVWDENDIFSIPHKSIEIDSIWFWNTLKIKCKIYLSIFQNLDGKLVTFESMNNCCSSLSGMQPDFLN